MPRHLPDDVDLWPWIEAEIPHAWVEVKNVFLQPQPGFVRLAKARYEVGQKEYKGTADEWLNQPPDWFDNERYQELLDLILYTAMRRVLHPDEF
jgi:hypothetical protein